MSQLKERIAGVLGLSFFGILGCSSQPTAVVPPAGLAGSNVLTTEPSVVPAKILHGKVQEVVAEKGVTYLLFALEGSEQKVWVALVGAQVKVGDKLSINAEIEMRDFFSKGLNRKFNSIIFGKIAA